MKRFVPSEYWRAAAIGAEGEAREFGNFICLRGARNESR